MNFIDKDVERYAFEHTLPESELLQRLSAETLATMAAPQMLTGRLEGRLLKLLAQLSGARRVLEIGTFTGYSALSMAEGLLDDGKVITCEIERRHADMARKYFQSSPHGSKIEIRMGPALETLKTLTGPFDLAFIDADKENYSAYYEAVMDLMRPGGIILVDNTLWSGLVLKPHDRESVAIDTLNKRLIKDERVENVMLTIRDGMQLVRKK